MPIARVSKEPRRLARWLQGCRRRLAAGLLRVGVVAGLAGGLSGCAVVAVADVAASAVVGVAGLAVDAAVGTVRIGGKIVGAGADALLGSDDETSEDD